MPLPNVMWSTSSNLFLWSSDPSDFADDAIGSSSIASLLYLPNLFQHAMIQTIMNWWVFLRTIYTVLLMKRDLYFDNLELWSGHIEWKWNCYIWTIKFPSKLNPKCLGVVLLLEAFSTMVPQEKLYALPD